MKDRNYCCDVEIGVDAVEQDDGSFIGVVICYHKRTGKALWQTSTDIYRLNDEAALEDAHKLWNDSMQSCFKP